MDIPAELIAAKNDAQITLMALHGVVGVSIGMREANGELFDELAVRVLVADAFAVPAGIPDTIGGVGVSTVGLTSNRVRFLLLTQRVIRKSWVGSRSHSRRRGLERLVAWCRTQTQASFLD